MGVAGAVPVGVEVPELAVEEKPKLGLESDRPDKNDGLLEPGGVGSTGMPSAAPKLNLFSAGVSLSLRSKLCVPQSKLARSWCNLASRWLLLEALVGGVPPGVASPEENCAAEEYRLCDDEPTGDAMVYLVVMVLAGDYNDW